MKKIKLLASSVISSVLVLPAIALAVGNTPVPGPGGRQGLGDAPTTVSAAFSMFTNALKYFYGAIIAVAVIFIILGGLKYVTASGDPEKAAVGKKQIMYGVIGIAIILGVWVIVSLVANIIGVTAPGQPF